MTVSVVGGLALIQRRRYPVAVYLCTLAAVLALGTGEYSGAGPWAASLFALYAVAAYSRRRWALACLASVLLLAGLTIIVAPYERDVAEVVGSFVVPGAAWFVGDNVRVRRAYIAAVEARAEHLEREQDAQAGRAVVEERNRIARELHDVVAHSMSVMVVQAGAARRTLERDPEAAAEAIGGEHHARGAPCRAAARAGLDRSCGRDLRSRGPARPPSGGAVGRAATTCRCGPSPGEQARDRVRRRVHGECGFTRGAEILDFLRGAVREMERIIVMVTHDPVSASYTDFVLFLGDGRIVDSLEHPTPERVLDRIKQLGN